ncbi:MAG TPA: DUF1343 domain-containing protein [Chloroflexota bacterium]|nr:DUF1343 domain-containing protein [Chloroflexota bacterium]
MPVLTGADVLLREAPEVLRGQRIGLVTNPGAVDRHAQSTLDLLCAESARGAVDWRVTRLFGPEHGLRGDVPAGGRVPDSVDPLTGLPVSSLYSEHRKPTAEMLADVDVLVIDLPQVGVRFFTNTTTTANCLEAAAEHNRPVVILDRPNPIGGVAVEGPLMESGYESFLGLRGQPIRYGCTLGELARVVNESEGIGAALTVVPCEGWQRNQWWDETALPWVLPSPNMPTLDTATVYPGTCLIEGTLLSEGRGTTRPFELVGAPWIEPYRWASALEERRLPGVRFRPVWFQPFAHKHQGTPCGGVQLHVTDREAFRPVATGVHLIETAKTLWPNDFGWRHAPAGAMPAIDRLYGSASLRERIDAGVDAESLIATWNTSAFEAARARALLYRIDKL